MTDWGKERDTIIARIAPPGSPAHAFRKADAEMVHRAVAGLGPESKVAPPQAGMRVVFNISSAHFPAVLGTKDSPGTYKNRHDLGAKNMLGTGPASPNLRDSIDEVLASLIPSTPPESLYYGAIELNGSGVRYFGDLCMVLRPNEVALDTLVLDRNSYDLARDPWRTAIQANPNWLAAAKAQAKAISGHWPGDVPDIAACKILDGAAATERRLTTGTIAAGILVDEDYIEVIRTSGFGRNELEEVRISASEAGAEARIGDRIARGPAPPLADMLWRHRRRQCERLAQAESLPIKVVHGLGRMR